MSEQPVIPDDVFVLDAICHGYDFSAKNRIGGRYADAIADAVYDVHLEYSPPDRPDLILNRDTFDNRLADPEVTARMMFGESHADACIYHDVPIYGYFKDGPSPLWLGKEMRERWPDRVVGIYGGISPHQPGALERVDELVADYGVQGLKLYPHDIVSGELRSVTLADVDVVYPILEKARAHGLKTIAIHKAVVMGPVPLEPYFPFEVGEAARDFPELTFEIVHGGWAFLEETMFLVQWHPNISVSLEMTNALLFKAPRRFAEIIGSLMSVGAGDRILWAMGGGMVHPRAFEEAFWNFEFPADLVEGYGIPPLTEEVKRGIFGLNAARLIGADPEAIRSRTAHDEFAKPRDLDAPWSCIEGAPSGARGA